MNPYARTPARDLLVRFADLDADIYRLKTLPRRARRSSEGVLTNLITERRDVLEEIERRLIEQDEA